ncbi:hypothetical protein [Archangium sp.]|uniref:hypothetical protein n=1 Tax=Archangium sp. TaxID=1872627 RepID=UPI002D2901BC|nr:hypothetical protein [Archangium sp.]HYO54578.1 hypothetical protein [Archangium sp.]
MRLPIEWTDRSSPLVPLSVGGHQVRLEIPALLMLADAVEAALGAEQRDERNSSFVSPSPTTSFTSWLGHSSNLPWKHLDVTK